MKNIRNVLFAIAIICTCAYSGYAQVFVEQRPENPSHQRIEAPSPRHVWIDEDWAPKSDTYVFTGARWVIPPQPGGHWIVGHWKQKRRGWKWIPGHWHYD